MHDYRESGNLTVKQGGEGVHSITGASITVSSAKGLISGVAEGKSYPLTWIDEPVTTLSEWMSEVETRLAALECRDHPSADADDASTPPDADDSPEWLRGAITDLAARQFERVNASPRTLTDTPAPYITRPPVPPDGDDYTYDLRTLPEREAAAIDALTLRCDSLAEQVAVLSKRVHRLEGDNETLRAVVQRHGDWMQLHQLRGEDAK